MTPRAAYAFDPDGPGVEPTSVYIAGTFSDPQGYREAAIDQFTRTQWKPVALTGSIYEFTAMGSWDPDGPGPIPERLVGSYVSLSDNRDQVVLYGPREYLNPQLDNRVNAILAWDDDQDPNTPAILVCGGSFLSAGGAPVQYVGFWNWFGLGWQPLGGGTNGEVKCLTIWDPDGPGPLEPRLVVGGKFTRVGGVAGEGPGSIDATGIAAWNGESWEPFPVQLASQYIPDVLDGLPIVRGLTTWDPDGSGVAPAQVVACGYFWNSADTNQRGVVILDRAGATWPVTGPSVSITCVGTADHDGDAGTPDAVVLGGARGIVPGVASPMVIWDGSQLAPLGGPSPLNSSASIIAILDLPADEFGPRRTLLIGTFTLVGGNQQRYAVAWDGHSWSRLGPGCSPLPGLVPRAFVTWDPDADGPRATEIYAAGVEGLTSRGDVLRGVSRYDGADWFPTNSQSLTRVNALTLFDPDGAGPLRASPVAGGIESNPDGSSSHFAKAYDGTNWTSVGTGLDHMPLDLCTWETQIDGVPTTVLVSVGEGSPAGQYLLNGQWRAMAVPLSASPQSVAQIDFDGAGPEPALLAIASHSLDPTCIVRVFSDPQTSRSIGEEMRGNPQSPVMYGPPLTNDMFEWDPDGPGPQTPGLVIASDSVYTATGTRQIGLNLLDRNGARQPLGFDQYSTPYPDVTHAALWKDGSDAVQWVVYSSMDLYVIWRFGSSAVGHYGGRGAVGSWDPDGLGPGFPVPVQLGEQKHYFWGQSYSAGVTQLKALPTPWIARPPQDTSADSGDTIELVSTPAWGFAERAEGLRYKWRRNGLSVDDGPGGVSSGGGTVSGGSGVLYGSRDLKLRIDGARPGDAGFYDIVVFNSCGAAISSVASVDVIPACLADVDDSGVLDERDIDLFIERYEKGDPLADLDRSGGIDGGDLSAFFQSYKSDCL